MDTFRIGMDGSNVTLRLVNVKGFDITHNYPAPSPFFARLLHDQLMTEMGDMFRDIRKASYEQGRKDAKAKRGAAKWFSGAFGRL